MVDEQKQDQASKQSIEVEIDGELKQFTAEDVKNLKAMQKSATEKYQKASPVYKAAEKFGLDPEDYLEQTDYAMEVVHKLMQAGVIDAEGNELKKQDLAKDDDYSFDKQKPVINENDIIEKALSRIEDRISKSMSPLMERQSKVEKLLIADKIKDTYPNLSQKELSEVFTRHSRDRSKTILEHAGEVNNESMSFLESIEKKVAEKYGVNIDEFNKRQEQSPDGGAAALIAGKKIKFKSGKKWSANKDDDSDAVTPKEAMKEFFKKQNYQ